MPDPRGLRFFRATVLAAALPLMLALAGLFAWVATRSESPESIQVFAGPPSSAAGPQRPDTSIRGPTLKVLVASMVSPRPTLARYSGLAELLGKHLGRPTTLLLRRGYAESNEALRTGQADVAFICTGAYLRSERQGGIALVLAVPMVNGKTSYHSQILVPSTSKARRFEDLRGTVMAFVDPMSLTGRLWAQHRVKQLGHEEAQFFRKTLFTGSHDRSVEAVAEGVVDAAAVDGLIADAMLAADPSLAAKVRVLERSAEFGIPPVVARAGLDPASRLKLQQALLSIHEVPAGRALLSAIGIDRFVLPAADHFDSARALELP